MAKEHSLPQAGESPIDPYQPSDSGKLEGTPIERVRQIIEQLRPSIQADGGDVEFLEFTDEGIVRIRLHGACVGCPSSSLTLQVGLERNLREHVPEVEAVEAID